MAISAVESGILNVTKYVEVLLAYFRNQVGGLREYTNNKGIIVGNEVRWPLVEKHALATAVNPGAPIVTNPVFSDTETATIVQYEYPAKLDTFYLNSTNSAAGLRQAAAELTVNAVENRFSKVILDELSNYDNTDMEIGDDTTPFNVDFITDLSTKARQENWPNGGRMLLLPPSAENTLMKDAKFYEVFSRYDAVSLANPGAGVGTMNSNKIVFYPYRGWNIGFMGQVGGDNVVGLPATEAVGSGQDTGYAWYIDRVGFAMNQAIEAEIWREKNLQGSPYIFKCTGSCGAKILDIKGVIGIKHSTVTI